jgi:hypothetical protein
VLGKGGKRPKSKGEESPCRYLHEHDYPPVA